MVCLDPKIHRQRVETRQTTIPGLQLPDWMAVQKREYHDWTAERLIIDTAHKQTSQCIDQLLGQLTKQVSYSN